MFRPMVTSIKFVNNVKRLVLCDVSVNVFCTDNSWINYREALFEWVQKVSNEDGEEIIR